MRKDFPTIGVQLLNTQATLINRRQIMMKNVFSGLSLFEAINLE